ncbi:MAG TPA: T9SS type A sorting domain-containing protein [Cytophagaceae bacterium]
MAKTQPHLTLLTALLLLFLYVSCSIQAQIILPIEVLGPDGTTRSVTVQVPDASKVKGLWMQVNNLSYADKGSVKVNGSPYVDLNNNTVVIKGNDKIYGGIGGAFNTIKLTLPLTSGTIKNGSNTISFRFNKSEGITIGYRVVKFNLVDDAGNKLLSREIFSEENPSTWKAPRPSTADIEAGKVLYETASLTHSPIKSSITLKAKCVDCHAKHGRDLKYFNYSNHAIIERAKFHGLSQEKGEQIASYIRSRDIPSPGRPWNPPYQPGPGLDAKPVAEWAAGAGVDWALDDENKTLPYLFPNGINSDAIATNKTLNLRELPIAMQLLDWKHWLPQVHPKDAFPNDWDDSKMKKSYPEARQLLETEKENPALSRTIWNVLYEYAWVHNEIREKHAVVNQDDWTREKGVQLYSLRQTVAVKLWEMMHEFGMEDDAQTIYGDKAEHRAWSNHNDRMLFEPSPHLIGVPNDLGIGGNGITNQYTANAWYQLALVVNAGTGHRADHKVNDYAYSYGVFGDLRNVARKDEPIRFMTYLVKGTQVADNGKTGAEGWNFSNASPVWLTWVQAYEEHWINPAHSEIRRQFINAYLKTWHEANKRYFPYNDISFNGQDGRWTIPNIDHLPKPINNPGGAWPDYIMDMINRMRPWGVDCTLLNDIADWGNTVWPNGDWESLKVSCSTSPLNAAVKMDNATVSGGQVIAGASTENMNVKKIEFFFGDEKIGEDTEKPFNLIWNNAPKGSNHIYAKATDDKGVFMFSDLKQIQVLTEVAEGSTEYGTSLVVYPNPTNKDLTISLNMVKEADVKINLIDLTGKLVLDIASGPYLALNRMLDLSTLSKGLYVLNVSINGEKLKARKIFVQ